MASSGRGSAPGAVRLTAGLAVGIAAVSCGALFARMADAAPLAIAALRVSWATLLMAPFALGRPLGELAATSRRERAQLAVAGAAMALHFALWIASLEHTTIASSVLLVDTTPFFLGIAGRVWLGECPPRTFWAGLALAFAGCVVVFHDDLRWTPESARGNALALGGAVAMAVYLLVGGRARQRLSLVAYVWPVYGVAAAVLLLAAVAFGAPMCGLSGRTHLFLFLLGLVPQCVGHTTYNWALRWLQPAIVALVGLAEPLGASLLAWVVLGEGLTYVKAVGGAIVLAGIWMATRPPRRKARRP